MAANRPSAAIPAIRRILLVCAAWACAGLAIATAAAFRWGWAAGAFDLDAEVPPGPPAEWARMIPVLTPSIPAVRTRSRATPAAAPAVDTAVDPRDATRAFDGRLLGPSSLTQVVTVDVTTHLPWTNPQANGAISLAPMSAVDPKDRAGQAERIYWLGLVPMLRLWFHPEQVSRDEAAAHLVELGEAALPALRAAQAESALSALCDAVRRNVGPLPSSPLKPREGNSPYEQMMFKFVERELSSAFPYDPKGAFGRRLEWLGEEVIPFIAAYSQHENSFLRRNAVSALALFRQRAIADRWIAYATGSADPVIRIRSLALLARSGYENPNIAPLCAQLDKCADDVEAARLARTLGDLRDPAAAASILQYGKRNDTSGDAVMTALGALGRIGFAGKDGIALKWVHEKRVQIKAGRYRPAQSRVNDPVDRPDGDGFRSVVMDQLALCALIRMAPAEAKLDEELLGWLAVAPANPNIPPAGAANVPPAGFPLARVAAVAQIDYLEALASLGARGAAALETIATGAPGNLTVRAHALRLLPGAQRTALAREWAAGKVDAAGLRAAAVELLDATDDAQAAPAAVALLETVGFGTRPVANPQFRAAAVIGLRALLARGSIPQERMVGFVSQLGSRAAIDRDLEELRRAIRRCVEGAAAGLRDAAVRDRVVELVSRAYERRTNLNLPETWKEAVLAQITGLLTSVHERRHDANYLTTVAGSIETALGAARATPLEIARYDLTSEVPLEEIAIFAGAKSKDPKVLDALRARLSEDDFPYRAVACLALGSTRDKKVGKDLLHCLTDEDPYVRLCSYRALKLITGNDYFCDWLYGNSVAWTQCQHQYKQCLGP